MAPNRSGRMNCKQGDLAIIIKSMAGNEGKIVQCLELLVDDHIETVQGLRVPLASGMTPVWRIDRPIKFKMVAMLGQKEIAMGKEATYCSDSVLRPLRGDLNDEEEDTQSPVENVQSPTEGA